jgi:hypothetical protein
MSNFQFDETTGTGYIEIAKTKKDDTIVEMKAMPCDLVFDEIGNLAGIRILGPAGSAVEGSDAQRAAGYEQGRSEAAQDIRSSQPLELVNLNLGIMNAISKLQEEFAKIAGGK